MTKNWKDIHPEFTEELQRVWEKEFSGFYDSYKRCKEYIDKGLRPEEAEFAKYLWQQGYYSDGSGQWAGEDAEEIAKKVKELRAERILWNNIGNFVSEMTKQLQGQGLIPESGSQQPSEEDYFNEKWKSKGFDAEEREKWIRIGLKPDEYEIADAWKNVAGLSANQVEEWVKLGLPPQDLKFACYLIKVKGYSPQQNLDLKQLREKFNNPPAQEYLDSYFPKEKRKDRKMLSMSQENLTEALDLRDFTNLEELNCSDNCLQDLKLPLQTENLVELDLKNNDLAERDLSVFQELVNLKYLLIGNTNQEKIKKGIYNRFVGSLEPLKNLTKLSQLDIDNTDLNGGVEYLPENLSGADNRTWRKISYSTYERPESKIKEIKWQLDLFTSEKQKEWEKLGFTMDEIKQWMTFSPKRKIWVDDYYLVGYLRHKGYTPRLGLDLTKLRREYNEELKKQKWFWESGASEAVLFRRWKKTNLKEQINSLEDEYEIIEKSDEGKTEVEKKEQTAQILQSNLPYGVPSSSKS